MTKSVAIPAQCQLAQESLSATYYDCYATSLSHADNRDPAHLFHDMMVSPPRWVRGLMRLRNIVVRPFGLKSSDAIEPIGEAGDPHFAVGGYIAFFRIESLSREEVVVSANDRHLSARFSLLVMEEATCRSVYITSVVVTRERFGDIYMAVIAPFHRLIVRHMLKQL